eukprot:scaffold201485_cov19-Tisochrysis_lutea.AAC.1
MDPSRRLPTKFPSKQLLLRSMWLLLLTKRYIAVPSAHKSPLFPYGWIAGATQPPSPHTQDRKAAQGER